MGVLGRVIATFKLVFIIVLSVNHSTILIAKHRFHAIEKIAKHISISLTHSYEK